MENMECNGHSKLSFNDDVVQLIRDSERLKIAQQYVGGYKYTDRDALLTILGIEKKSGDE